MGRIIQRTLDRYKYEDIFGDTDLEADKEVLKSNLLSACEDEDYVNIMELLIDDLMTIQIAGEVAQQLGIRGRIRAMDFLVEKIPIIRHPEMRKYPHQL